MNNECNEPEFKRLLVALSAFTSLHDYEDMEAYLYLITNNLPVHDMSGRNVLIQQVKRISERYQKYVEAQNEQRI